MQKSASFAERLVLRRNRLNLTQTALAEKSGVSPRSISDYEQGEPPTFRQIEKLATALEVTPAWLLGAEGEMQERRGDYGSGGFNLTSLPVKSLEDLFNSLGQEYKQAEPAEKPQIVESLDAVIQELKRRTVREVILHEKRRPPAVSSGMTPEEEARSAEETRKIVEGVSGAGESGQPPGAGGPPPHKSGRPAPSSPGAKPGLPPSGGKGRT